MTRDGPAADVTSVPAVSSVGGLGTGSGFANIAARPTKKAAIYIGDFGHKTQPCQFSKTVVDDRLLIRSGPELSWIRLRSDRPPRGQHEDVDFMESRVRRPGGCTNRSGCPSPQTVWGVLRRHPSRTVIEMFGHPQVFFGVCRTVLTPFVGPSPHARAEKGH